MVRERSFKPLAFETYQDTLDAFGGDELALVDYVNQHIMPRQQDVWLEYQTPTGFILFGIILEDCVEHKLGEDDNVFQTWHDGIIVYNPELNEIHFCHPTCDWYEMYSRIIMDEWLIIL